MIVDVFCADTFSIISVRRYGQSIRSNIGCTFGKFTICDQKRFHLKVSQRGIKAGMYIIHLAPISSNTAQDGHNFQ